MRPPSDPIGLAMRLPNGVEPGKNYKKAQATLLETLKIHGLKEEYDYIIGGEKGPPLNRSGPVPMEVGGEGETTANQGGGDAPLGC